MSIQLFPVYLAGKNFVPPNTGTYYIVAKDGIYMRVERVHGSAFVKVKEIPFLNDVSKSVNYTLPKIPARIMAQAKTFFAEVFDKHRSESYLTLLYSKKINDFKLWCPTQTVSYSSVNYDRGDQVALEDRAYLGNNGDEWQMVGTIHSHCDFSAFHSGTDQADEASFDGIHLTFGHVNSDSFSIASSSCFNANRTVMAPLAVADGISNHQFLEVDEVEEDNVNGFICKTVYKRSEQFYTLVLNDDENKQLQEFKEKVLPQWMAKVEKVAPVETKECNSNNWVYKSDWSSGKRSNRHDYDSQGWLFRDRTWSYGRDSYDNEWGIREWDGD